MSEPENEPEFDPFSDESETSADDPKKYHAPHDRFTRFGFSDPEIAQGLMRLCLRNSPLADSDLSGMFFTSFGHVDARLKEIITDGVFQLPLLDQPGFVCICVEHKSAPALAASDCNLVMQLRTQEIAIMNHHRRQDPDGLMPIVLLVGLVHGKKPYDGPLTSAERIRGPQHLIPRRWIYDDLILIDLCTFDDEELAKGGKLGVFLLMLKHIYDSDIETTFERILPDLVQLQSNKAGAEFIQAVMIYLIHASPTKKGDRLLELAVQSMTGEVGGSIMTIAEQIRKKAIDETTIAATKASERRFALSLQAEGFPISKIAQLMALSEDEVEDRLRPIAS